MIPNSPPSRLVAAQQMYARYAGVGVLLVGLLVMIGWLLDIEALKGIVPGLATMKFNTALCFALAGSALLLLHRGQRRAAQIGAGVVALIGLLTLAEYVFGTNFGLDQWLAQDTDSTAQYPGRMSPASAFGLALLGSSLLLLIRRRWVLLAQTMALVAGFLALLAILGYLYGVESLYRISTFSSVALHTAVALLALSFGILNLYPDQGVMAVIISDSAGGLLARRLLPAAVLIPPLLGWLRLRGQEAGLYDTRFGVSLFALSNVVVFSLLLIWTARSLHRVDRERAQAVDALRQANEGLERRVAERTQQLRESETKFSTAFQASPVAISIATLPDGRWIEINEALAKMTGYSREELIGHTSSELGLVDAVARTKILEAIRTQGSAHNVEIQVHTKSKAIIDVLLSVEQIELNSQACTLASQYDITDLRRTEKTLAAERNLLRTLIDSIPDYVFVKDTQGRFLMANNAVLAVNNVTRFEQLAGKTDFEFFDPEIAQPFYDDEQAIIASGQALISKEEPSLNLKTGEKVWLATTKVPLRDEHGHITSLLGVSRNITERKQTEEKLRESEQRVRLIVDSTYDAFVAMDSQGFIVDWNRQAQVIFGWSREEILGQRLADTLIPPQYREAHRRGLQRFLATGEGQVVNKPIQITGLRRDGREFPVELTITPIPLEQGYLFSAFLRDITERQRAEEALRETEERFRSTFERVTVGMSNVTADGRWLDVNPALCRMMGYTREEMLARTWMEMTHPDDLNADSQLAEQLLAGEIEGYSIEKRFIRKDGSPVWVNLTASLAREPSGAFKYGLGVIEDISARKQAEAALAAERNLLRTVIDNLPAFIYVKDTQSRFLLNNASHAQYIGKTPDELIGRTDFDFFPREMAEAFYADEQAVLQSGQPLVDREETAVGAAGRRIWALTTKVPLHDREGHLIGIVGVTQDITERKRTERRFQALLESAPDAMVIVNQRGEIVLVNSQVEQLFGYKSDELVGQPVELLMPDHLRSRHPGHRAAYTANPHVRSMGVGLELYALRKDGSLFPVEISLSPIETEEGVLVASAIRDITERKRVEERLKHYAAELERSNEELNAFAYIASHDLQEPLRKIQAFGDRLKSKAEGVLDEQALDYLARMQNASGRMQTLIHDLLAYSRVSMTVEPFAPVNLNQVKEEVLGDLEIRLHETGAVIEAAPLPIIDADPSQMRQLFQNLISNALKFQREGVAPVIKIGCQANGVVCQITIADNGIGFDGKYSERIFGVFERLHGRGEYEGTGIGLAICRKIVQRHGGTIIAQGVPGAGATFIITLPFQTGEKNPYG